MKKVLRFVAVVLSLCIVCLTFSGCGAIDALRKKHAVWMDEDKTVISLNGKEYKLLPESEFLDPVCDNRFDYNVTESDVPVLLSDMYGESITLSKDKNFIVLESSYEPNDTFYGQTRVYSATDRYEEIKARIEDGPIMDGFCYEYSVYDDKIFDYSTEIYHLTDDEVNAVLSVINNNETTLMEFYDGEADCFLEVYRCSEDAVFRKNAFELVFNSTRAYLVCNANYEGAYLTEDKTYVVPNELYATIRGIADDYMESMDW